MVCWMFSKSVQRLSLTPTAGVFTLTPAQAAEEGEEPIHNPFLHGQARVAWCPSTRSGERAWRLGLGAAVRVGRACAIVTKTPRGSHTVPQTHPSCTARAVGSSGPLGRAPTASAPAGGVRVPRSKVLNKVHFTKSNYYVIINFLSENWKPASSLSRHRPKVLN